VCMCKYISLYTYSLSVGRRAHTDADTIGEGRRPVAAADDDADDDDDYVQSAPTYATVRVPYASARAQLSRHTVPLNL